MQPGALGSAVIGREASGWRSHRSDRAMTAVSANWNGKLLAERWPGGSARFSVSRKLSGGAESAASEQRRPEGLRFLAMLGMTREPMPQAAGVWHSEVYEAMLVTEAAGGLMLIAEQT